MEKNKYDKFIGWALIVTVGLAILGGLTNAESGSGYYTIVGLGIMVFGVWGGIRLIKGV